MMTIQTNAARVFRFVTCVALVLSVALVGGCGKSAESMLSAAKESRAKGDLQAAVLQLKSLLQETPDHPQARFLLGALYNETGDFRSAEKELRRALELKVEAATLQPELARSLFMQGEFKKVLDEIGPDGISDADALASVLSVRGNAHLALRQSSDARASFERALAAKPNFSEAILGQARLAATEKDLPGALALVDKAIAADPKHADAWLMKGDMLRAQGKAQDAAGAYSKLIEARPDHVGGLLALASLEIVEAKFDDAIKRIEAVRKKAPGNPMAVYFQALIEFRRGNNQAAREHVLQVLKAAPTHLPSNLLAGAVEFALGGHEQAQARLRFVLERTPTNLYARRLLAASLTRTGQSQKAIEVLDPALKQAPDDAVLLALAGEV